jgi:membrane protein DedA with SNARE-associated domain
MLPCTLALEPGDDMDALWWLTPKARAVSRWILKRPSPTLCWTMWMGVLYFCLDVGVGKITVIALSWLNVRCATLAPGMVAVIVCAFGIFLFLLPPIPGVPVYLFAGVVLVASLDDSMGFWPAVFITSILCLCIKLTACAIQQKVFGENLSDRVAVRRLVGMNSMTLRAIRYNLSQKGLTPAKVAILCGGPDWPTSVLCGILRLPLYECLLGTLPVYPIYLVRRLPHACPLRSSHTHACWTPHPSRWCATFTPTHGVTATGGKTRSVRLLELPPCPTLHLSLATVSLLSPCPFMRANGSAGHARQLFTVIAGAFNLKTGETWASAASTMLAVCSLTMTSTTLAAMYYIEDTVAKKRKELEECAPARCAVAHPEAYLRPRCACGSCSVRCAYV